MPGLKAYRETPGKALPISGAQIRVAGQTVQMEISEDKPEAVFDLSLPQGDAELEATFTLESGSTVGAYYTYVEKL